MIPKTMHSPCTGCQMADHCSDNCMCPAFHDSFILAWSQTVAFLKGQIK